MFILQMVPTARPLPLVNSPSPLLVSVMTVPSPCNATVTETWAELLAVPEEALILTATPLRDMEATGQAIPYHLMAAAITMSAYMIPHLLLVDTTILALVILIV
jgi:hypothetical protein